MSDAKKITRRAFGGTIVGGILGLFSAKNDSEVPEKVIIGGVIGGAIGAGTGAVGAVGERVKPKPTPREKKAEGEYRKNLVQQTLKDRLEERTRRQDDDKHR